MKHQITVALKGGKHVCDPTDLEVHPGDTVEWGGNVIVFFPDETPFREGRGPFDALDPQTVKPIAPLKRKEFSFKTLLNGKLKETVGDIIVT